MFKRNWKVSLFLLLMFVSMNSMAAERDGSASRGGSGAEVILMPAVKAFKYEFERYAYGSHPGINLTFKVRAGRGVEPAEMSIVCPDEFGDACNDLIDAVIALGGQCIHVIHNTVCNVP